MNLLNVEIKARCANPDRILHILKERGADYKGIDHQVDTYFNVPAGRLKLREGKIEQNLIYYLRSDTKVPKVSDVSLVPAEYPKKLLALLKNALGVSVVVEKQREIYFIKNVKFHIDRVKKLGNFVEIEAIDNDGTTSEESLRRQCRRFRKLFNIRDEDLVAASYADMLKKSG